MQFMPSWMRNYQRSWLSGDLVAGVIVTVMLIPQSLAYALLAGLPPEMGLYASILPMVAYAVFGSSMTLAVGPVAVASIWILPGADGVIVARPVASRVNGWPLAESGAGGNPSSRSNSPLQGPTGFRRAWR